MEKKSEMKKNIKKNTKKNTKKHHIRSNEDQILRMAIAAVVVLFVVGAVFVGIRSLNPRPDISEGMKRLEAMEQANVSTAEKEIQALAQAEAKELEEKSKRPKKEIFGNTLILGDFIAQGVCDQEVLDQSFVLATEGASVSDTQATGVAEKLAAAAEKKPKVLFLVLGVNDAAMEGGNADTFGENYQAFLTQVKGALPDTKIYVNSILPVQSQALEESPGLSRIPEYNGKLKKVCREMHVAYIDNSSLVKDEYYTDNGKNMKKKFYTAWVTAIAQAADL